MADRQDLRHHAAEGQPDHSGRAAAGLPDRGGDVIGIGLDGPLPGDGGGGAVAGEIKTEHAALAGQRAGQRPPEMAVEPDRMQQHDERPVAHHLTVQGQGGHRRRPACLELTLMARLMMAHSRSVDS